MSEGHVLRLAIVALFAITAAIMAIRKSEGWGWFLFIAFIALPGVQ